MDSREQFEAAMTAILVTEGYKIESTPGILAHNGNEYQVVRIEGCHDFDHKQLFDKMREPIPEFKVGDLVEWKCEQLRPSKLPLEGQFLAVVEPRMLTPLFDRKDGSGSAFYAMPLDLKVSAVDGRGDYIELIVDARRVQLAK